MNIQQFSQLGKRSNNEDSLGTSAGLLTVCDGMGGHNYGERASAFVKEAMLQAFAEPQPLGKMEIQQQLNKVQTDLNQLLENEPELEKMGTTFTGVFITPDVWYAAHIGDSRIYLFRPSEQKLWHTWDHSLVGELMRTKEITVEAGRFHPMSNRISKAIIAQKDNKPVSASIVKIDELKKGDIFMLCSDGVVEGWGDFELVKLFSDESLSFEEKCKKIAEQCNAISKDNNTAIIAEVGEDDAFSFGSNEELEWTSFAEVEADYNQYVKDNEEIEEEKPKLEEPKQEEVKQEVPQPQPKSNPRPQSVHQPQSQAIPRQSPKPTKTKKGLPKTNKKLIIWLIVALLAIAAVAVLFLKGGQHTGNDADDSFFSKCNDVEDYRGYVSRFGKEAKHYDEAVKYIKKHVSDSTIKANAQAEKDFKHAENELYKSCKTVDDYENYLRKYPNGRYVDQAKQKIDELKTKESKPDIPEPNE